MMAAGILLIVFLWAGIGNCGSSESAELAAKLTEIIIALDNSGSMKQNDPKGLLREVVQAFAMNLGENARLGIVGFDEKARVELGLTEVETPGFKDQVTQSLTRINYGGRRTDIPAGVERALYELRERGRPEAERVIVVLTDGVVDLGNPAKDIERARWLREDLAREAKRLGVRVFGIAFTEGADFELMQSIGQTTGGDYFRVLTAGDIPGTFERITARLRELTREASAPAHPSPPSIDWRPWALAVIALLLLGVVAILAVRRAGSRAEPVRIPAATLRDVGGSSGFQTHRLVKTVTRIGRDRKSNDIAIDRDTVSGQHAEIAYRKGAFYLRDLRSTNGTSVNGKRFSSPGELREVMLRSRDRILIEACEFEFVLEDLAESPRTRLAVEGVVQSADDPKTKLKTEMCPRHPSWKATELCGVCRTAYCKQCMRERDGKLTCVGCLEKGSSVT